MNTVICPNKTCGKEVSNRFEKCPFCGTPLQKRSVDEVLGNLSDEEMQKKDFYREKVLNYYNLDNNVSDEQYEVLEKKYQQIARNSNPSLLTPNAESIIRKNGKAVKIIGVLLFVLYIIIAIVFLIISIEEADGMYLLGTLMSIITGVITYIVFIVIKSFIDVFVNISVTLQDINSKTKSIL